MSPNAGPAGARGRAIGALAMVIASAGGTAYAAQANQTQLTNGIPEAATAASTPAAGLELRVKPRRPVYGQPATARGHAPGADLVVLEERRPPRGFTPIAAVRPNARGGFAFTWSARRSGVLRATSFAGAALIGRSKPQRLRVAVRLRAALGRRHLLGGGTLAVRARLGTPGALTLKLQVRPRNGRWSTIGRRRVMRSGRVRLLGRLSGPGVWRVRIVAQPLARGLERGASRLLGRVFVYRPSYASWYGPGLYGGGLACGGRLTPATVGVAHRWLPCGTRVAFRFGGRTVVARVVDRGPYVGGREWDLTAGLKQRLGFGSTGVVWVAY